MFETTKYVIAKNLGEYLSYSVKGVDGKQLGCVKGKGTIIGCVQFCFEDSSGAQLGEIDGKVAFVVYREREYEIKDKDGQLSARIRKRPLKLSGSEWLMEDPNGQQLAKVEGDFARHNYRIAAPSGGIIAQIHKKWASIENSYGIEILRQDFDPFLILSYTIAMDFTEHMGHRGPIP
jgi:uncharacterized protein YxjI